MGPCLGKPDIKPQPDKPDEKKHDPAAKPPASSLKGTKSPSTAPATNGSNQQQQQQQHHTNPSVVGFEEPKKAPPAKRRVDFFIESVVPAFVRFSRTRKQSTKLLRVFLRTLGNYVHNSSTHRTTLDEARRTIGAVIAERCTTTVQHDAAGGGESSESAATMVDNAMEDRGSDEGMTRLLDAWTHHNSGNALAVDAESASAMLRELDLHTSWDAVRVQIEIKKLPDVVIPSPLPGSPSGAASNPSSPNKRNAAGFPESSSLPSVSPPAAASSSQSPQCVTFEHILTWYYGSYCNKEALTCFHELWRRVLDRLAQETSTSSDTCAAVGPEMTVAQWLLADSRSRDGENNGGADNNTTTLGAQPMPADSSSPLESAASSTIAATSSNNSNNNETAAKEFLYRHFGGHIVEENFCSYVQSHRSNSVFDARSVSSVWHDMTQPLPNYLIRSQSVSNDMELSKALADNTRAFLLKLSFNDATGAVVVGGPESALTLKSFCETVRDRGFKKYAFPIIICFPPWETALHSRGREERVAQILTETLGPMLAKGLMFRGATIRDPEFSPATLRHKVLIMAEQAKLNPFVGLYVADMARTGLGVRVTDVKDASPAASAGVGKDDWITRINEDIIESKQNLRQRLSTLRIGEEFTVTRENLTHARVVVGAAVDGNDASHASALSNLIFFNYDMSPQRMEGAAAAAAATTTSGDDGSPISSSQELYPWETSVIETDDSSSVLLESNNSRPVDHLALVHHMNSGASEDPPQQQQQQHGAGGDNDNNGDDSVRHVDLQSARRQEELSLIGVEQFGAQLVDARCSRAAEQWCRGTFVVNGHCGYVLRETLASSRISAAEWSIKIIAVPPEVSKGVRIKSVKPSVFGRGEEAVVAFGGDENAAGRPAATTATSSSSVDSHPSSAASTPAVSSVHPFETALWELPPIRASNHSRIAVEVVFEDNRKLEAVLPAHLLRTGLRAVPFRSLAPDGSVSEREAQELGGVAVDLLCYVSKKKIDPSAVAAAEMAAVMAAKKKDDDADEAASSSAANTDDSGAAAPAPAAASAAGGGGKKKRGPKR